MMETEAKEKRKRRVKREEGPSRANRIAERERGRGRCHGWIPVDYDRNNGIRIIRFMRTDDTYNRPIIITLGKELQWRLKVRCALTGLVLEFEHPGLGMRVSKRSKGTRTILLREGNKNCL